MPKFYSEEDIEERVNSEDNLVNKVIVHKIEHGRKVNQPTLPLPLRKVITVLANQGESQRNLSETFGRSTKSVSLYERGEINPGIEHPELAEVRDEVVDGIKDERTRAEKKAVDILLASMNILPSKLGDAKAKELSSVAKDMSIIANQMADRDRNPDGSRSVHLHLYAPQQKKVTEYEVIDV